MFTPSRLALARKKRGLTLVSLAEKVGVTAQSLSNAERGKQTPNKDTLDQISDVLGFPVSFFSEPEVEQLSPAQVSFRALSKMTARTRESVLSSAQLAIIFRQWMEDRFRLPEVDLPTPNREMNPELAAEYVRARWGLSDLDPAPNMVHLLESRGVAVFSLAPEHRDVDAFSFWWNGRPFVVLNTLKTAERSRFDAAHELGHLVMHDENEREDGVRTLEKEANDFSSAFLMPSASLRQTIPRTPTTDQIIRYKKRWNVSAMALAYRLRSTDTLTEWNYRRTVLELGRLGYDKTEPDGMSREKSQLIAKVFQTLRSSGVSFTKISSSLRISPSDLNDLVFGLAIVPITNEIAAHQEEPISAEQGPDLRLVSSNS